MKLINRTTILLKHSVGVIPKDSSFTISWLLNRKGGTFFSVSGLELSSSSILSLQSLGSHLGSCGVQRLYLGFLLLTLVVRVDTDHMEKSNHTFTGSGLRGIIKNEN